MTYKKYLLFGLLLILFTSCKKGITPTQQIKNENNSSFGHLGQLTQKQQEVKKELDNYLNQLKRYNTDMIVEMTYPRLFYVIDPELYRQSIVAFINSSQIEEDLYDTNITKLSKPIKFSNGTEFVQAEYSAINRIRFLDDKIYDTEKKMNFLYDVFIHKFGVENIHFNLRERTITKKELIKLLIIKEKDSEWKFLGDNHFYRMHYPNILPLEIYKIIEGRENNETT